LDEAVRALEALLILWAKASLTSRVTAHTYVIDLIVEETDRLTVTDAHVAVFSPLDQKHARGTASALALRGA
jgi:hypothetical protein